MLLIDELLLTSLMSGLSVFISGYILSRIMIKNTKKDIKIELEAWLNSETGQKALYMIGGLIANGAKTGFGLQKQSGAKGLEGIFMNLLGQYLGGRVAPQQQAEKALYP